MNTEKKETIQDNFEKALDTITGDIVSAKEVADVIGVDKSTVYAWTQEKRFSGKAVLECGCTKRYILSRVIRELQTNYMNRQAIRVRR